MENDRPVSSILTTHWVPAIFTTASYAILCGLVIIAMRVVAIRGASTVPGGAEALLPWQGIALIVAGVFIAALIVRKIAPRAALELILGTALFLGTWFYLWTVFSGGVGLLFASAFTLAQAWWRRVWIHDVFILVGAAGVALNFGFLLPNHTVLIVLVGLAIYDIFAGRAGGPIARFAGSLVHRGVIPGLVIPGKIREMGMLMTKAVHQPDAIFLGAGDLILPLMLVARAAAHGWLAGTAVAAGTLIAAGWLGLRGATKPFPALVPLAIGSALPYIVLLLLGSV